MDKSSELVAVVREYRVKDLAGAYAFAFGMVSAELTDDQLQRMIDSIKAKG